MIDPVRQVLEKIEKASVERDKRLADSITSVIRLQNISGQLSSLQQQKEILAHIYEKNSAYSNLVMIGGYAAMFALWQLMKHHFNYGQELLVAILVASSIILFAGFEVFKMISSALFLRRLDKILTSGFPESERVQGWQVAWNDYSSKQSRAWIYFLVPTVLTGFGAGFVLLWIFLVNI
jgi:hypothetical protein